jgi:hypothetical protein
MIDKNKLYTLDEAAKILNVPRWALDSMIEKKMIEPAQIPSNKEHPLIRGERLQHFIDDKGEKEIERYGENYRRIDEWRKKIEDLAIKHRMSKDPKELKGLAKSIAELKEIIKTLEKSLPGPKK